MKISGKAKIILALFGVLALVVLWQYVSYLFKFGYSRGERTGIVRKISVKGPPGCKFLEGEMALQGSTVAQQQDIWKFSVDDDGENNPLVVQLKKAEHDAARVTLEYRQDKEIWWRFCNKSEYFITKVQQ
jgi:hypothetical protein